MDANELMPGLWLGAFPTFGNLTEGGFTGLVVVAREHVTPDLANRFPGVRVAATPLDDLPLSSESVQAAITAARTAHSMWKAGHRVLIACHMGINRSALVAAMVLHIARGISGAEAVQAIRRTRRGTLTNPAFLEYLLRIPRREP